MSDFWVRKMKTCFQRHDIDKDGAVTQKDFEAIAARCIASGKLDDVRAAELTARLIQVWETYFKDPSSNKPVDEETSVALFKKQFLDSTHRDTLRENAAVATKYYFTAVDANADGFIQADEYELFFENIGIDKTLAAQSFQALDTNKDGQLSLDEFVTAGVEFFLTDDESSPAQLFWGPLV